jgi:hypothetical protein
MRRGYSSFPNRDVDRQRVNMHHKPILALSFPFLVGDTGSLREAEAPQQPAEHHPHLHKRQVLTGTARRAVRERDKCSRVVLSCGRALAEPSFRQECVRRVEVSPVPLDAVCVKEELCRLRNDPTGEIVKQKLRRSNNGFPLQLPKYFGTSTLVHRALRPAWNSGLKTKGLVAIGIAN